jgi:ferrochelatase
MAHTTVLLVNLGTPDAPTTPAVRRYLRQFLGDKRVIDIPALWRWMLVNLIIAPFRSPKSSTVYRKLWTPEGSPLLLYGQALKKALALKLGREYHVELAMRYQSPSMTDVLERIRRHMPQKLVVVPLYPHYASSTTGSTVEELMRIMKSWYVIPELHVAGQFYNHPGYIETMAHNALRFDIASYDHIVFSFHGLPVRQVDKVYDNGLCAEHPCETEINDKNKFCYKATCYATSRLLAQRLGISSENYTVAFQSRLSKKWLEPFSDEVIRHRAAAGDKRLLFFSPAFVADCLETTVEIGIEYAEMFHKLGGQQLDVVESLNAHPLWVETLTDIVLNGTRR